MTKRELIKLLEDAPFNDDAKIYISHNFDADVILRNNCQQDITGITVLDENELGLILEVDKYTQIIIRNNELQ